MSERGEFLRDGERAALVRVGQMSLEIAQDLARFIIRLLPGALRAGCVAAAGLSAMYGTLGAWQAFGGDGAALIPAMALGVIPFLFAFVSRVRYGGMLAAGFFTYAVAQGLGALPAIINQILIVIVLAALTFADMAQRSHPEQIQNEHTEI
jgi:hypothetical protein